MAVVWRNRCIIRVDLFSLRTSSGSVSVHHVELSFFFGFEQSQERIWMAAPEKALLDVLYLSPAKSRLFAALPELEFPKNFSPRRARQLAKAQGPKAQGQPFTIHFACGDLPGVRQSACQDAAVCSGLSGRPGLTGGFQWLEDLAGIFPSIGKLLCGHHFWLVLGHRRTGVRLLQGRKTLFFSFEFFRAAVEKAKRTARPPSLPISTCDFGVGGRVRGPADLFARFFSTYRRSKSLYLHEGSWYFHPVGFAVQTNHALMRST
ncbi:MAG: hypothetical protein A2X46_14955 [Lentisphaerae bacterium GWF2_57_35]|nr:MAG: hypothetical protein A2X46_14955 [Lentisphaerae bacterium GWF2_57_35]